MAQSARDGSPDVWVVVDHQNGATRALRRGRLYCHPDAGLIVWDAVAVGVAAAVLQINQRLADAGQLGLRHRILIQVVLHPDTDFVARQTFETGEEPVHIRVREQVARRRRGNAARDEGQIGGGAVRRARRGRRRRGRRAGGAGCAIAEGIAPNSIAPATMPVPTAPATARRAVRAESNMDKLLHRKWRGRNHGRLPASKAKQNVH